jgi:hypothetical protein
MTTEIEGVMGQGHALAALYPRERPGTLCTQLEKIWIKYFRLKRE